MRASKGRPRSSSIKRRLAAKRLAETNEAAKSLPRLGLGESSGPLASPNPAPRNLTPATRPHGRHQTLKSNDILTKTIWGKVRLASPPVPHSRFVERRSSFRGAFFQGIAKLSPSGESSGQWTHSRDTLLS